MNSKRLYFTLVAVISLLLCALVGGTIGIGKLASMQARQLTDSRAQLKILDDQQSQLDQAKQDIQKYQDLSDIAKSVVPQDKDQAQTIRQIVNIATASGVPLSSISFPSSTLGLSKSAGGSSVQLSQLDPVKGIAGLYTLQLTVQTDSSHPVAYDQFLKFLTGLEQNRRTALVSNINITPDSSDSSLLSFQLILNEYIKP